MSRLNGNRTVLAVPVGLVRTAARALTIQFTEEPSGLFLQIEVSRGDEFDVRESITNPVLDARCCS